MWWVGIGFVSFIVIFGMISSAVEQERDKEFIEKTAEQLGKAIKWWYGEKRYK